MISCTLRQKNTWGWLGVGNDHFQNKRKILRASLHLHFLCLLDVSLSLRRDSSHFVALKIVTASRITGKIILCLYFMYKVFMPLNLHIQCREIIYYFLLGKSSKHVSTKSGFREDRRYNSSPILSFSPS